MVDRPRNDLRRIADKDNPRPGMMSRWMARAVRLGGPASDHQHLSLDSPDGLAFLTSQTNTFLASNCWFDSIAGVWNRYDVAQPAAILWCDRTGSFGLQTVGAGANPIAAWVTTNLVTPAQLTQLAALGGLGATAAANRTTNLALTAATITTLLTLAIPAGKWLVFGQGIFTTNAAGGTCDVGIQGQHWSFNTIGVPISTTAMVDCKPLVLTGPTTATLQGYSNVAATCLWVSGAVGSDVTGLYAVQVGV